MNEKFFLTNIRVNPKSLDKDDIFLIKTENFSFSYSTDKKSLYLSRI